VGRKPAPLIVFVEPALDLRDRKSAPVIIVADAPDPYCSSNDIGQGAGRLGSSLIIVPKLVVAVIVCSGNR
jgi:hypothetical protein